MIYKGIRSVLPLLLPRVIRGLNGGVSIQGPRIREFLLLCLANGRTVVLNYKTSRVGVFDSANSKGAIICFNEFHAADHSQHG